MLSYGRLRKSIEKFEIRLYPWRENKEREREKKENKRVHKKQEKRSMTRAALSSFLSCFLFLYVLFFLFENAITTSPVGPWGDNPRESLERMTIARRQCAWCLICFISFLGERLANEASPFRYKKQKQKNDENDTRAFNTAISSLSPYLTEIKKFKRSRGG